MRIAAINGTQMYVLALVMIACFLYSSTESYLAPHTLLSLLIVILRRRGGGFKGLKEVWCILE